MVTDLSFARWHRVIRFAAILLGVMWAPVLNAQSLSYDITALAPAGHAADTLPLSIEPAQAAAEGSMMSAPALNDAGYPDAADKADTRDFDMPKISFEQPAHNSLRWGGKLRLTNGVATLDGASGGGLAGWAIIAGKETAQGIGGSAHVTYVELPDYNWQSHGAAIGLFDRFELSYARQNLDTIDVGTALGLGRSYVLNQDVFGAKLRLFGDAVYGPAALPQFAIGFQYKNNLDDAVTQAVGATSEDGTDFYIAATKILLAQSLLLNGTLRYTKANQLGLLGFGGDKNGDRSLQFEGSLGYMLSRNLVVGAEYRTKPDNLSVAREDDWLDVYAAWSLGDHFTVTGAYVDLGSIATADEQRGALLSLQAAF